MQPPTILFKQNYDTTAHVVVNQGGTGSGKTYAILQVLFCIACETDKQVITVAGQDIPNLKAGALRDACAIHESSEHFRSMVKSYNRSERIFNFHNGTSCCGWQINLERWRVYFGMVLPE